MNGSLLLARVQTLDALYERAVARTFFTLLMLVLAASMALLGLVGIYGVIAYAVTQRTREIGILVALGAQPAELRQTFIRHGVVLTVIGVVHATDDVPSVRHRTAGSGDVYCGIGCVDHGGRMSELYPHPQGEFGGPMEALRAQ